MPEPFRLHVSDEVLDDLRSRLARTRWPDEIAGSGWAYGTNLGLPAPARGALARRLRLARAGGQAQRVRRSSRVPLAGIDLHFIHQPGVGPDPYPLLLAHGWPGSVWEFNELIPRLTDPGRFGGDPADAFTVVAPSLPGYTFSYAPGQPRFDVAAMSDVCAELMTDVLGYPRFAAQGGDWGGYVVGGLGARHARQGLRHPPQLPARPRETSRSRTSSRRRSASTSESSRTGRRRRPATTRSRAPSRRRSPTR